MTEQLALSWLLSFPGSSDGKESVCNAEDRGSILGSRQPPGEGNGNPLQYSCLGNPKDRGAWRATVSGVTNMSDMAEPLTPSKSGPFLAAEALRQPTF